MIENKLHPLESVNRSRRSQILTLVFRDKRAANHSIERLFDVMTPHFKQEFTVRKLVLPHQPTSGLSILKNVWFALRRAKGICHITGDAQYLAIFLRSKSTIMTIHDCGYLMQLKGIKKKIYKWMWFCLPCRRVGNITTISDSTRTVLAREVGNYDEKLHVVENCITLEMQKRTRPFNASCPRILQIGTGPVKNLDTLIKSVEGLPCELHIVGKISEENLQNLEQGKIRYVNEFAVSDERLQEIYAECDLLFFASRHEGFGLPILEGQAAQLPVITSTCYSMPKVSGGAALLVDPESPQEVRIAIQQICENPHFRDELVQKGLQNIERYQAEAVARKYMDIYSKVLEIN